MTNPVFALSSGGNPLYFAYSQLKEHTADSDLMTAALDSVAVRADTCSVATGSGR
jgi:hypothetical protein